MTTVVTGTQAEPDPQDLFKELEHVLAQAWDYIRHDQFDKAYETFTKAFELVPQSAEDLAERRAEALYGQALCLRKLGKPDEAGKKLEDVCVLINSHIPFLVKEVLLYIDKEQYDKAVEPFAPENGSDVAMLREVLRSIRVQRRSEYIEKVLGAALKLFPHDPGIRSEYGWLKYVEEKYDEALDEFNKVLADKNYESLKADKFKGYESALQGKIASLRLKRQYQKAHDLLKDATLALPDHQGIQAELGWLYFDQKRFREARKIFEKIYRKGGKFALQWIISCFRSMRDFAAAEKWIKKALEELKDDPARIGIQNEKGWLFVDKKQYVKALEAFDKVLRKVDETNQFALQGKIASLRLQGCFTEASELVDKALLLHPDSTGILIERGWLFFDQKRLNEAEESFAKAIRLAPYRIELKFSRIEVLMRTNRSFEAEKTLLELKKRFPNDPQVMERLGRFYIHQRDLRRAKEEFESILRSNPNDIAALGGLAAVCLVQSSYNEAIERFRKLCDMDPNNPAWYTNWAWALVREWTTQTRRRASSNSSLLDQAERLCERALELDPESPEAYGCLGTITFRRGKLRLSEDYLLTSIKQDSVRGNHIGLGALYVQMGRYDEAQEVLKEALRYHDDVSAHIEFGNLFLKTGRIKEAIHEFRRAMGTDPTDEEPPRALSIALMEANELNEAETVLRDALRRLDDSKRWRLHLTRAQLLTKRGDETENSHYYDEALKEANKAIDLNSAHPDPHFYAGFIRAKLKDYKGARKCFQSCLEKDDHDEAQSNLTHVQSLIQEEKKRSRGSFWAGFFVGALAVSQLVVLWYFFKQGKITETILSVLLPIFSGLVVVAFLIPVLYKLKLPGLEAELRERTDPVSSGLKGEVVFSTSPLTISSGPR